ncbi:MAG: hypothetical protein U0172_14110 [Nitrospiraceae bacterium]
MTQRSRLMRGTSVGCLFLMAAMVAGCSGPQPILYPTPKVQQMGPDAIEDEIDACRKVADQVGADEGSNQAGRAAGSTAMGAGVGAAGGAIGGAISGGGVGIGALIGAATGAVWGLFSWMFGWMVTPAQPSQTYVNVVNRCLAEKGYDVSGWQ